MAANQFVEGLPAARRSTGDQLAIGIHSAIVLAPVVRQSTCWTRSPTHLFPRRRRNIPGVPMVQAIEGDTPTTLTARTISAAVAASPSFSRLPPSMPGRARPRPRRTRTQLPAGRAISMLRQLNLTEAQKDQIKTLVGDARAQSGDAAGAQARKIATLRRDLHAAIFADTPIRPRSISCARRSPSAVRRPLRTHRSRDEDRASADAGTAPAGARAGGQSTVRARANGPLKPV